MANKTYSTADIENSGEQQHDMETTEALETEQPDKKQKLETEDEKLSASAKMFRSMREDRDVIKGASVRGIIGLSIVAKPNRDVFFRTHPDYSSIIPIVDVEQDMKKDWYAVTDDVVGALARIGITVSLYELFLILTADNALRLVPVRLPDADSEQNAWNRSKRIILDQGKTNWVRMSTNRANAMYDRHLPADPSIFTEPIWPDFSRGTGDQIITEEEIFRLAFYDRGRVIDSLEHALYLKWAGRNAAR